MNMLEYQKQVLRKVSFDKDLFNKELRKSQKWLKPEEMENLEHWAAAEFALQNDSHGEQD